MNEQESNSAVMETPSLLPAVVPGDTGQRALTSAQARVDSVARVLDSAMNKASSLVLSAEEIAQLKGEFPDEAFKPGAAGKEQLIYIEHAFLRDRFDSAIGMGQWALIRTRPHWCEEFVTGKGEKAARVYADVALLIRGCMVSEAIGEMVYYPNNAGQNYGDAAEGAVTAGFRRCAKQFGVGLQAWKKDFCDGWWQRKRGGAAPQATRETTTKVWTPDDWKGWLLAQCAPYPSAANEVFAAHGLITGDQNFSNLGVEKLAGWKPSDVKQLAADVAAKAKEDDQLSGAEVESAPGNAGAATDLQGQGSPAPALASETPANLPPGCKSKRITVKAKSEKPGTKRNGQPFCRYGICSESDEWFNTFSGSIADKATQGATITVWYTTNTYGNDLHAVTE